ncbi:translocation/assembly module TamB domain-containing protein [Amphiplicatus metriothermophilus]|uniref:Autotransporter translocation and assembly factor TamB n=1 Tax=Amphiplicatus metriothermophilus TaxID=1519374 RepID=A0A239PUW5_9PROT|nr:translocation/assembly module TamB domain-containing protein [Amphiplicatus metriothermophilus]MBB5519524.1 translocation and assembly module TamB [Amphiplicatus metriothermophilus]SNT74091.1 Autotransporter translocation and assembly factor TamB [Amphiplicatus metriothermophilus]
MRRALVITLILAFAAILVAALAWAALFRTAPGRELVLTLIERELGDALGGEVEIRALDGAPPGFIVLHDLRAHVDGEPLLTAARIEFDWRPFALLSRRVHAVRLHVEGLQLLRAPPARKRGDEEPRAPPWPPRFPYVAVDAFSLVDARVEETVAGRPLRLDGEGALDMGGAAIKAQLRLSSRNDTDLVDLALDFDPAAGRLFLDLVAASQADGAVAALVGLDGPLFLEAKADAPVAVFELSIDGSLGGYGDIMARLGGDLSAMSSARAEATLAFGPKLAALAREAGPRIDLAATLREERDRTILAIERLDSAAGGLFGEIRWTVRRGRLAAIEADLDASLAGDYRSALQRWLGPRISLAISGEPRGDQYALKGAARGTAWSVDIEEGRTDLREIFAGRIDIAFEEDQMRPSPFDRNGTASARVFVSQERIEAENMRLRLGASSFDGEGAIDLSADAFELAGAGALTPDLAETLVEGLALPKAAPFQLEARGAFDRFEARLETDAPPASYRGETLPAATLAFNFAGLPRLPSGDFTATRLDGRGRAEIQLRSSLDGRISAPRVLILGEAFRLGGNGSYDPARAHVALNLSYEGGAGATPWPGLALEGAFAISGRMDLDGAGALTLDAPRLDVNGIETRNLAAAANGTLSAFAFSITADRIAGLPAGEIAALSFDGEVDLEDGAQATLARFEAQVGGFPAMLDQPARLSFGEGVEISGLRAQIGRDGRLAFDGAFSQTRWRARLALEAAPIRPISSVVTASLDLDTRRDGPAVGDFLLRSRLTESESAAFRGTLDWDGERLRLVNAEPADAIDFDLAIPMKLRRTPELSVSLDGALAGSAGYSGPAQAVALFLPTALHSLEGALELRASLAGTLVQPELAGVLTLTDGAYTEFATGLSLTGVNARAEARPAEGGSRVVFSATARGPAQDADTIAYEGEAYIGENARIESALTLNDARLAAGPVSQARASGKLAIAGPIEAVALSGEIALARLEAELAAPETTGLVEIEVVRVGDESQDAGGAAPSPRPSVSFDVTARADDKIFVRGRGLESEWRANVRLLGDADAPLILGDLGLRRGHIDFSGRRFDITRGEVVFDRLAPNDPVLNIRAEYETGEGVIAAIEIGGRASAPSVSLTSTPQLPSEDVMALVLFGKPATELSAIESLQMAQALAQLSGVAGLGGPGVVGAARRALGLDMLNVDFDSETGVGSLAVGKYVANGLFVSATQDARGENGAVRVQYEITDSITVETELKQNGEQTVSANWKRDF